MAIKPRTEQNQKKHLSDFRPIGSGAGVKKIGFDFDKVFVSYPPVIPDKLIDFLYKGKIALIPKKNAEKINLSYRIPGLLEKGIRIISHNYIFRPPMENNIKALRLIRRKTDHKLYLISSRFGFLKDKTHYWLDKNKLKNEFYEIHFNFENSQPHLFKERTIKSKNITHYVDDDLDLLVFLSNKNPSLNLFWLTKNKKSNYKNLPPSIKMIKSIKEFYSKYI